MQIIILNGRAIVQTGMSNLRYARTEKLKDSDWMANSDVTMGPAWTGYRQQLRDLRLIIQQQIVNHYRKIYQTWSGQQSHRKICQ